MKYSKEFKIQVVKKYLNGEFIDSFGDGNRRTVTKSIRKWVRLYEIHGEEGLSHRRRKKTIEEKRLAIEKVLNGESIKSVAYSLGVEHAVVSKWMKLYQQGGIKGIELSHNSGRPPNMKRFATGRKSRAELEKENEYLKAEIAYLKN